VVSVRAVYPGASAQVLEQTVAAPLENAINGVERMLYMSSNSSSNGMVEIQVTFEIGTDVDQAAQNVNNRVKQAEARLPEDVRRQGVVVEKGSSAFLQVIAFYSPDGRFDDLYISNFVTLNVLDELKAAAWHHQRADLRCEGLRDADLAAARPARAAAAHDDGRPAARSTSRMRSSPPARSDRHRTRRRTRSWSTR